MILPSIQTNSSSNLKADSDSDGIANPVDLCPNTANGTSVNMNGCADNASKYFWVGGSETGLISQIIGLLPLVEINFILEHLTELIMHTLTDTLLQTQGKL